MKKILVSASFVSKYTVNCNANILIRINAWRLLIIALSLLIGFMWNIVSAQNGVESGVLLSNPILVNSFYKERNGKSFWFFDSVNSVAMRQQLVLLLNQCEIQALDPKRYPINKLKMHLMDKNPGKTIDQLFTDAAISYLKDLLIGVIPEKVIEYDEFSAKALNNDNKLVLHLLATCRDSSSFRELVADLEPATNDYRLLKEGLSEALSSRSADTIESIKFALNITRWISHFHCAKYIVVNIASGKLQYYERDSLILAMKVVTGTPATPTPRFAAYCNQVILYPYWNVPRSIAVNEILPLCKKAPGVLAFMNMQVLDKKSNIVNPQKIPWKIYTKKNFPYRFRQSTGCDNALGVIKFNLTSPFGVYLHDTNAKSSFLAKKRYFSHGCIRLEKPVELANNLLDEDLDEAFLKACTKNEKPVTLELQDPVPVFLLYTLAGIESGTLVYFEDVYNLMQ